MAKRIFETFDSLAQAEAAAVRLMDRGVAKDHIAIAVQSGLDSTRTVDLDFEFILLQPDQDLGQFAWWDSNFSPLVLNPSGLQASHPEPESIVWLLVDEAYSYRFDEFRNTSDVANIYDSTRSNQLFHDHPESDLPPADLAPETDPTLANLPPLPPTPNTNLSQP